MFRFKKFNACHCRSSMKIGVDAVLLGAWAGKSARRILDIGTGCGVISLMLAQRMPEAFVEAIDIDPGSVEEAAENFEMSQWKNRLSARLISFPEEIDRLKGCYDLIVSNPPYFSSGITNPASPREIARHQGSLSVFSIIEHGTPLLCAGGKISMIFPSSHYEEAIGSAANEGLTPIRECWVRNNFKAEEKRVMVEFGMKEEGSENETEHLTLFEGENPTNRYHELCREFYLKF